ncbi:hypothetical protein QV06_00080 [Gallibacterium genomosp. 3]|uniref:Uncharacterized protein n=1 Tax=Gallibacterium genomosp. 3 TaxID=505345 RepID=A0A1A7PVC1_9PAST|nr:hypothetical protein [Gallibacterium genomosp. 3]OBX05989.1 hypothetical protein QV06_00080 [Gallibacterium genomosp. 3]
MKTFFKAKYYLFTFLSILAITSTNLTALADESDPALAPEPSIIDDTTQVNPLITLRSLATGSPLTNGQYEDERNLAWIISEALPQQTLFSNQSGLTQFRAPDLQRCLYTIQNRLITANCDTFDSGSLWRIIPTKMGGVQIKSLRNNLCLSAGNSYSDFRLANCQESETQKASVKLLWLFSPAAINASLSPELPTE